MSLIQCTASKLYTSEIPSSNLFLQKWKGLNSAICNDIFLQIDLKGGKLISQHRTIIYESLDSAYNVDFQSVMIFKYVVQNRIKNEELWC